VDRVSLQMRQVQRLGGEQYLKIDDRGLHIWREGQPAVLEVDNVVICAGQEPNRQLAAALTANGKRVHIIGGADVAQELDARRAIAQGTRLALTI